MKTMIEHAGTLRFLLRTNLLVFEFSWSISIIPEVLLSPKSGVASQRFLYSVFFSPFSSPRAVTS